MTAPISRDRQIDLMTTARDRAEARAAAWNKDPVIRSVLLSPTKEQIERSGYTTQRRKQA